MKGLLGGIIVIVIIIILLFIIASLVSGGSIGDGIFSFIMAVATIIVSILSIGS